MKKVENIYLIFTKKTQKYLQKKYNIYEKNIIFIKKYFYFNGFSEFINAEID